MHITSRSMCRKAIILPLTLTMSTWKSTQAYETFLGGELLSNRAVVRINKTITPLYISISRSATSACVFQNDLPVPSLRMPDVLVSVLLRRVYQKACMSRSIGFTKFAHQIERLPSTFGGLHLHFRVRRRNGWNERSLRTLPLTTP